MGALASCAEVPAPAPPVVVSAEPPAEPVARAAPPASATASSAAVGTPPRHTVSLELRRGEPPCKLAFDGGSFEDHPDWFVISNVSRIATEAGGGCAAGTIFDLEQDKRAPRGADEEEPEPLAAGVFQKPYRPASPDIADAPIWNVLEDLDFDGYADLCVVVMTGAYNYSQKCWLFDPSKRSFVRQASLDEAIFMKLDPAKKQIESNVRAGGPVYAGRRYAWDKGALVLVAERVTTLGERPDGKPLPTGFSRWVVRRELRNGKLVKVFEGPEKN